MPGLVALEAFCTDSGVQVAAENLAAGSVLMFESHDDASTSAIMIPANAGYESDLQDQPLATTWRFVVASGTTAHSISATATQEDISGNCAIQGTAQVITTTS